MLLQITGGMPGIDFPAGLKDFQEFGRIFIYAAQAFLRKVVERAQVGADRRSAETESIHQSS